MQLPTQGQWWSNFETQTLQSEQWEALGGLSIRQLLQYLSLSSLPLKGWQKKVLSKAEDFCNLFIRVRRVEEPKGPFAKAASCLGMNPGSSVEHTQSKLKEASVSILSIKQTKAPNSIAVVEENTIEGRNIIKKVTIART